MDDKAISLQDLLDIGFFSMTQEQAVKAFSSQFVNVCFPAHTASPEALRKINARIATMDLPTKGNRHYTIGRGNMKGGGGPWIVG